MQPFKEVINTEAEYKAACTAHRENILSVLDYIYRRNKENVFNSPGKESDKLIEIKKVNNLSELIQEISDSCLPVSPDFN